MVSGRPSCGHPQHGLSPQAKFLQLAGKKPATGQAQISSGVTRQSASRSPLAGPGHAGWGIISGKPLWPTVSPGSLGQAQFTQRTPAQPGAQY